MKKMFIITLLMPLMAGYLYAADNGKTWNFDHDKPGSTPANFYGAAGSWKVRADATAPSRPHVLAQLAKNSHETFNVALVTGSKYRDLDISVKMRAIGGRMEQGGGIVWRAKDPRNYYVVRYNPLESNFRLYKIVNNTSVRLASTEIMNVPGWHTLRVVVTGNHITCFFDGTKYIDRNDGTYSDAGLIGLWTRADAQTYFDDLTVTGQ